MSSIETDGSTTGVAAGLSDAKRALLERRLRGRGNVAGSTEIPPRPAGEVPMSFGQERLWFQSQISSSAALFNIAFLAHIEGDLDVSALEASVNDVISRHEALRAGFRNEYGAPRQYIAPVSRLHIERVYLRDAPQKASTELKARARIAARQAFDLAAPPLMRVTLFEIGMSQSALLFIVHHIIWDGWSSGVFINEITQLYQARVGGLESPLAPLTTQYGDFAHWQRKLMASEGGARQIDHWREQLAGLPELISLPTDWPRLARQKHVGAEHDWKISADTFDRITTLARRHNVTQFTVLLAAYNVLLMHYSGQRDIAIGTAVAYRTHPALEKLVGFFVNVLAMRTALTDDPTFEQLIARTQQTSINAQSNQDAPFDLLVEKLAPKRELSHNPLFQVAFVQHHLPIEELRIGDLRINFENLNTGAATFDLVLHIYSEAPGLKAVFEFDTNLFHTRTIAAMAGHFNALLDSLLDAPQKPVSRARLLTARQETAAIADSTAAFTTSRDLALLHNLSDTAAPHAIAVACGEDCLTYSELSVRSNQIAHHLRTLGVTPDAPVAMLLEPSVDMIVAIYGIMKADGAYLPLDPSYPTERIRSILNDCGARTLITTSVHAARFGPVDFTVLPLDDLKDALSTLPSHAPTPRAREDNIAYFIYTSGSTGLSKGVMLTHRNAVASTLAREQFYVDKVLAFLLVSSISFDSSVAGIFWTLAQGGKLHIATEAERRDPAAIARIVRSSKISHLLCLPSLHSALLDVGDAIAFVSLRCCVVAGEVCRPEVAEKHFRSFPEVEFVNEYGPTECAVWSTAHRITKAGSGGGVPIGRPIPGAQTIVEGAAGDISPPGPSGELCIGGAGLARGYAGRPDLTADRFRPNPYGRPGERLYRSGDRVRLNADGDLEFLGRLDEQIKIRGYRVDPSEIETVLLQSSGVVECVVVARSAASGASMLVAYIETTYAYDEAALKKYAFDRLPSFMRPDLFIKLDEIPRLANGKVNRNGLPAPTESGPSSITTESEDASFVELLIADIWRDVLGVTHISGANNFFALGGNSLAAMQVVARAQRTFGREIPVGALFESPDLRAFAKALETTLGPDFEFELGALLSEVEAEPVD